MSMGYRISSVAEVAAYITKGCETAGISLILIYCKHNTHLDNFYNLVLEVVALNAHLMIEFEQEFWKCLYFDYWVSERIGDEKRMELRWFVNRFYPELLDPTLSVGKVEKRKTYSLPAQG